MLSGTRFEVVASRLFQARTESRPVDRRHRGAAAGGDDDRPARDQQVVADAHPALAVEPALAAEELDAAFFQPGQLPGVVEVVDHLVAAVEDRLRVEVAAHRLGDARAPGAPRRAARRGAAAPSRACRRSRSTRRRPGAARRSPP